MYVKEIWCYPVKSMAGYRLQSARLTTLGIEGDRVVQVVVQVNDKQSRTVTARTFPNLLGLKATLDHDGNPLVENKGWTDPGVLSTVQEIVGQGARLVRDDSADRFDVLPLLVTTDGAIAEFGRDGRRLRPNIVIGGVAGLEEREWQGGRIIIGKVVISIHDLRGRCIMTTFDPDSLAHDPTVLRDIVKRFGGTLGLNCAVTRAGKIHVNDEVTVIREDAKRRSPG